MTIARCPECHDEVRVPAHASSRATVACPWCGTEFELSRLLAKVPPLLIVVADPDAAAANSTAPVVIDTGEKSEAPMFDFEERAAPQAEPVTTMVTPTVSRRPRPQPKGGGLITAVAVLFGGLCSIPLAQLCLWWIFGQDPVEAGPKVAEYAAFLVPKKFRGTTLLPAQPGIQDVDPGGASAGPQPRDLPGTTQSRSAADATDQQRGSAMAGSGTLNPGLPKDGSRPAGLPGELPGRDAPAAAPRSRPEVLESLDATSPQDIETELQNILVNYHNWISAEDLEDDVRPALLQQFYEGYCQLGSKLAFANPLAEGAEQWMGPVEETLGFQLVDPRLLNFLGNKAKQQLDEEYDEPRRGIALAGRLESVEQQGEFWKLRVRLGNNKPKMVDVMGWMPPPSSLEPGDSVIVLGARIADPSIFAWQAEDAVEPILGGYLTTLSGLEP